MTTTDSGCPRTKVADVPVPTRTKIAGLLALIACVACCALPYLIVAGIVTGSGAALLQQTLVAGAIGLGVLALGMWWLHRRRVARRATAEGAEGCGDDSCAC